jgi:hypothetical protein
MVVPANTADACSRLGAAPGGTMSLGLHLLHSNAANGAGAGHGLEIWLILT